MQYRSIKSGSRLAAMARTACIGAAVVLGGCSSSPYKTALRDLSLSPERRLELRVRDMQESADRALVAAEGAASAVEDRGRDSARAAARRTRLVNDAEAATFEYSRQVLIVLGGLDEAGTPELAEVESLRASMAAAEESLAAAVTAIQNRSGQAEAGGESGEIPEPSLGATPLEQWLAQAEAAVEAVSRDADAALAAIKRAHVQ